MAIGLYLLMSSILFLYCYSYECFASVWQHRWAHPCLLEPRCSKFESGYEHSLLTTSLENFSRSFQMTTSSNKVGPILYTENCPTKSPYQRKANSCTTTAGVDLIVRKS